MPCGKRPSHRALPGISGENRQVSYLPGPYLFLMPVVTITMARGRSYEQKKQLSEEIAQSVATVLGVPVERVTILIHELEKENIALSGKLLSEG